LGGEDDLITISDESGDGPRSTGDHVADKGIETPQVEGQTPWPTGLRVIKEEKKKKDEEDQMRKKEEEEKKKKEEEEERRLLEQQRQQELQEQQRQQQ
jgi:hypothetical protein